MSMKYCCCNHVHIFSVSSLRNNEISHHMISFLSLLWQPGAFWLMTQINEAIVLPSFDFQNVESVILITNQPRVCRAQQRHLLIKNVTVLRSNSRWPQLYRRSKIGLSSRISCPQVTNISNIGQSEWFCLFGLKYNSSHLEEIWVKPMLNL